MTRNISILALGTALLAGYAANAQTPASRGSDLAGLWTFEVPAGANVTRGAMTLTAEGSAYRGILMTDQGIHAMPIRSLTVEGREMNMTVESPNGTVTFHGMLDAGGRSFSGTVTYLNGQRYSMSARKQ